MLLRPKRSAFNLFQLLLVLALLLILLGLLLPAVQKVREASARMQSMNNLKQLGIALHNHNATYGVLPAGVDDHGFSASAKLLPFIDQNALSKRIDFKKSIGDKANAPARAVRIKTLESPLDPVGQVKRAYGPTNYLFNDLAFFHNSKSTIPGTFTDGTSNTVVTGETLKGDNGAHATDVRRQYVLLKKGDLKRVGPDTGVKYFKADTNIAADRCASWMDGRFLMGTANARLRPNDKRPDVSCGGVSGVSSLRSYQSGVIVGLGDGSVRSVSNAISEATWKAAFTPAGEDLLGADW
jgi:hypothetical protein